MTKPPPQPNGVQITGSGSAFPAGLMTNADLEKVMDTSDEWILKRTGIARRRVRVEGTDTTTSLATTALQNALADAGTDASELDLIITATMTPDMPTPGVSNLVASNLGAGDIASFDLNAACSGFVFALNMAHDTVALGRFKNVALIGADCVTRHIEYSTFGRGAAILFGDAAGAVVLKGTTNPELGLIALAMHSDGSRAKHLYIPECASDFFEDEPDDRKLSRVQMNGQAVFKFAVSTFPQLIADTLDKSNLNPEDVDHFVCHQSNARILSAARDRFGLPEDKLHINIERYGNTVAASVPLVFDELRKEGRVKPGQRVMFLAFGAGLTWGSSLWRL